ncbi:MAG: 3-deoxy-7-phosphoheptulonate synthase [Planctomycetota bacterium]|jgi:3-deoxy-7-phosphoheptulonate synthase
MILRLRTSLSEQERHSILKLCKDLGYSPKFLGSRDELLELTGPGSPEARSNFDDHASVVQVIETGLSRELTARPEKGEDTVITVGSSANPARFGGGWASLIAGPCAVENLDRLQTIASSVKASGATLLRGGAFKPRTSPYSFRGLGPEALDYLAQVREQTGLPVVSEVLDPRDIEVVGDKVDMFQIGSRNMANAALLDEVGRTTTPVLLKRGMAATVREFLLAAEYILAAGNPNVVMCERGVRGFDKVTRNLLDVGAIAYLKQHTHLPVIADPSHAAGKANLVAPIARAGIAAGADGLIIEVHNAPEEARSDGPQALSLNEFELLAADVKTLLAMDGRRLAGTTGSSSKPNRPSTECLEV